MTVYAVFANIDEAEAIGHAMIDERLAACVNILAPCRSIFRWEGRIATAEEVPALFKTTSDRVQTLIERIAERHSYVTPAVVTWPVPYLLADYGDWVEQSVG